jgi:organic hydroperoxide reductase OsmC/OhrA
MIHYPMEFTVQIESASGIQTVWNASVPQLPSLKVAIPPEFEGPGGGFSPEDFFILATANCFAATFKVMAEKSNLNFEKLHIAGVSTVDRDSAGRPWIQKLFFKVKVTGSSDRERMERILNKASQSCIILHSVKSELGFEFEVL